MTCASRGADLSRQNAEWSPGSATTPRPVKQRIYVLAGSSGQFRAFVDARQKSPTDYVYLHSPDQLRGVRGVNVVRFGTWYDRSDLGEFELALRVADAFIVDWREDQR